jgi:hypothetical protein
MRQHQLVGSADKLLRELAVAVAGLLTACTGSIGDPGEDGNGTTESSICAVDTPIRRMTRVEYNRTTRDLFGFDVDVADQFVAEEESNGFNNQAKSLTVSELHVDQFMQAAEMLSEEATLDMAKLLPSCDPASEGDAKCAEVFIETFGKRAFRRPLTAEEKGNYKSLFDTALSDPELATFEVGIQLVIQAMLQSPQFLYRVEFGTPDPVEADIVLLDDWEMASRLSYLVWGSMPDEELFSLAESGKLRTKEALEAQARRMLEDPRAREAVRTFHEQWLQLGHLDAVSKDPIAYPNFSTELIPLWREETAAFVESVVFDGEGTVEELLGADYTMMNADLAAFYGVTGEDAPTGSEFVKVKVDASQRAGFLTHSSLLASHAKGDRSSPVLRGKFVREQLLCELLPLPPNDLVITPPPLDSTKTTREQFEEIGANPDCAGCHLLMNPIGFGFENFDAVGLYRTEQNDKPIDASGEVVGNEDVSGEFVGVAELAEKLAKSEDVRTCVAAQWFRFGYGRGDTKADTCSMDAIQETFASSNGNIKELLVALTQTDAFRYRREVVAGGDQ